MQHTTGSKSIGTATYLPFKYAAFTVKPSENGYFGPALPLSRWIRPFRAYPRLHERPPSRLFLRSLGAPCPGTRTLRWVIASGWANPPSPVTWVQLAHAKTPDGCRAPPSSTSHCTTWLWHCASRMAHLCVGGPRLDDPFRAPAMSMRRESPRITHRYTPPVVRIFRSSTSPWS